MQTLPSAERYSYVFQGNSQDLDQSHASPALFERYPSFELVKINSEFFDQISDHDPNLAIFDSGDGTPIDLDPDPDPDPAPGDPAAAEFLQLRGKINAGQPVQVRFEVHDAEGVRVPSAELSVTLQTPGGVVRSQDDASNPRACTAPWRRPRWPGPTCSRCTPKTVRASAASISPCNHRRATAAAEPSPVPHSDARGPQGPCATR